MLKSGAADFWAVIEEQLRRDWRSIVVRLRDSCAGIGIDRVERVEILTTEYTEAG